MKLNHVAIAVPSVADASKGYKLLGADVSGAEDFPEHGVKVVFVNLSNTKIELMEPIGDSSPIAKFMEKKPSGGIHHICLEVESVKEAVQTFSQNNIRVLGSPRPGAHGKDVVFIHPQDFNGTLIELEEA